MAQGRTISLPEELATRLARLEDRLDLSQVCAQALERELDLLEAQPAPMDPEIQEVVARLQTASDRWYQRGSQDGRAWALAKATRDDLVLVTQWPAPADRPADKQLALRLEALYRAHQRLGAWLTADADERAGTAAAGARLRLEHELRATVDEGSYARGWYTAAQALATAVLAAVRVGPTR